MDHSSDFFWGGGERAWGVTFYFLPLNDVIEVRAVYKKFYHETRKNKFLMKKMSKTRKLYRNERILYAQYYDSILWFGYQLSVNLKYYISDYIFFPDQ